MKKRSSNLRLTLMAVAMPIGLAACESEPTGVVLNSIDDCRSQQVDVAQCETAYRDAVAKHAQVAPRYEDAMQCESDFGSCQPAREEGRTYYSPPMGGFLLGYALAGGFSNTGARQVAGGAPLYRDYRGGGYRNAGGDAVSRQTGPVTGKRGSIATPARAITVSRAGFGSRAAARGTFGSRGGS
ncbi:DUF1190 domain-containing protein [Luteimonas sp. MC1572]|uniref:DUF1190 domain-containing protein n=1 Tax=Luteimonas sp. MC1572 TaxID=2799325 RepID=UPI0018F0D4E3|nr:DUF1190 domain-containing protein [Luteimonas sp. MC1572]MBJ6981707.1 DUF1190 domain-containing protein [Luteimonas sp. MC1572]QQO02996.1 DUF1190 domain-containing protein [Luteimonas sp. MC1572]